MVKWTSSNMPSQSGRSAVVTGTGGLGFETALALAHAGAEVIIAGRNPKKGAEAVAAILKATPAANVCFEALDLASLASVADFGRRLRNQRLSLDILINNAGVMRPPKRQVTEDGFELQLGTNYLGHFALTAHLMPLLRQSKQPRVVTLSSVAARQGIINFDNFNAEKNYQPMPVYAQSKLACLMFALEFQRRSEAGGWGVASMASHPGLSRTELLYNSAGRWSAVGILRSVLGFMFQPVAHGAWPTLYAATAPLAKPGSYIGPERMSETRGYPTLAKIPAPALNQADCKRLWELSETMTGVRLW
ncbi:SDR family oxidoreductase [Asticcacaulis machinosus]|uniref:SDR family oxidoreductase n=1 Tax=Asticcacaulis machinosus TaxID=2984211 RepID=A0ABT5HMM8_9CAUL|nr:SDR family oxidoreductase [Asticcacaulis machinosus]MDC7677477.1 SDR family oxidoreductase [Asticcacaulis machinosus]